MAFSTRNSPAHLMTTTHPAGGSGSRVRHALVFAHPVCGRVRLGREDLAPCPRAGRGRAMSCSAQKRDPGGGPPPPGDTPCYLPRQPPPPPAPLGGGPR